MKRFVSLLLMTALCITLAACGNSGAGTDGAADKSASDEKQESNAGDSKTDEGSQTDGKDAEPSNADSPNNGKDAEPSAEEKEEDKETGKILVAYFSCTGTTKKLAESLAGGLEADIYEIAPEVPYTSEDLDYNDDSSRSTKEMDDASSRPAIAGSVENMEQYGTVVIAYPIWWGEAPRIIDTFVESYDFSGKTVVPFCTSGGSGIGSSAKTLESLAGSGTWLEGKRFGGGESEDEMTAWINGLGIE